MPDEKAKKKKRTVPPDSREERLKAALKTNIARRKAQAKARSAGPPGEIEQ